MPTSRKPFCFRCGGEPKYQLTLNKQGESGPFWPLCFQCFLVIPWAEILRAVVEGMEKQEKEDATDAG